MDLRSVGRGDCVGDVPAGQLGGVVGVRVTLCVGTGMCCPIGIDNSIGDSVGSLVDVCWVFDSGPCEKESLADLRPHVVGRVAIVRGAHTGLFRLALVEYDVV